MRVSSLLLLLLLLSEERGRLRFSGRRRFLPSRRGTRELPRRNHSFLPSRSRLEQGLEGRQPLLLGARRRQACRCRRLADDDRTNSANSTKPPSQQPRGGRRPRLLRRFLAFSSPRLAGATVRPLLFDGRISAAESTWVASRAWRSGARKATDGKVDEVFMIVGNSYNPPHHTSSSAIRPAATSVLSGHDGVMFLLESLFAVLAFC